MAYCAVAVRFLVRRSFKVSLLVEISENLQQIEQSSKFRFLPRNGLKTWRTAPKRPKFKENTKKIVWINFKNTVFCFLKLPKIPKCGPFYVQNGEKRENVYESARYAPPDAKERTCFHRITSLTTLCKAPIVCPWSIFQRYMYLIRAYACVKKALLLADRGWKWQMLYQPIIVIGRIFGRVYSSTEQYCVKCTVYFRFMRDTADYLQAQFCQKLTMAKKWRRFLS